MLELNESHRALFGVTRLLPNTFEEEDDPRRQVAVLTGLQ